MLVKRRERDGDRGQFGRRRSAALELEHGHADGQEQHYPRDCGHEAQVHVGFQQVPATGQYAPQRRRGHGQR